jgi:hypothetical protein
LDRLPADETGRRLKKDFKDCQRRFRDEFFVDCRSLNLFVCVGSSGMNGTVCRREPASDCRKQAKKVGRWRNTTSSLAPATVPPFAEGSPAKCSVPFQAFNKYTARWAKASTNKQANVLQLYVGYFTSFTGSLIVRKGSKKQLGDRKISAKQWIANRGFQGVYSNLFPD